MSERDVHILGINCAYHESSACILRNGKVVVFTEEERLNRVKHARHSNVFEPIEIPILAILYCLREAGGLPMSRIAHVA